MAFWDDITIGSGNRQNSATLVRQLYENGPFKPGVHEGGEKLKLWISHNSTSYWVDSAYLKIEMIIFKDTVEGKKLTEMLNDGTADKTISEWMDKLAIKNSPREAEGEDR